MKYNYDRFIKDKIFVVFDTNDEYDMFMEGLHCLDPFISYTLMHEEGHAYVYDYSKKHEGWESDKAVSHAPVEFCRDTFHDFVIVDCSELLNYKIEIDQYNLMNLIGG